MSLARAVACRSCRCLPRPRGYVQLLAWARSAARDSLVVWAVEGTRHYGLGLARYLTSAGEQVSEIGNSRHVGKRRVGNSDVIDAVRAASAHTGLWSDNRSATDLCQLMREASARGAVARCRAEFAVCSRG